MNALKRRELKAQETKQLLDKTAQLLGGVKETAIELAKQPVLQMIAGVVLIEVLQRVQVTDRTWDPVAQVWRENRKPILSQVLATGLETTIIASSTLQSIGGLSGLTGLLGAIK